MSIVCSLAALLLLGCGNSNSPKQVEDPSKGTGTPASDAQAAETPEEKFARQQTDTLGKMCERLVDCSFEDAKEKLPPEEYKKLDDPNIQKKAVSDCTDNADKSPLSPKQVINIRECLGEATECSVFTNCLVPADKSE
jgi:hypothetical protein